MQEAQAMTFDGSLHDAMAEIAERNVADLEATGAPSDELWDKVAEMGALAHSGDRRSDLSTLFSFIAMAHTLHAMGEAARAGNPRQADELHGMGQLFLSYAVGDIDNINADAMAVFSEQERESFGRRLDFYHSPDKPAPGEAVN